MRLGACFSADTRLKRFYFFRFIAMATPAKAPRPASTKDVTPPAPSSAQPIARFGYENISVALFTEQVTGNNGHTFEVFNVSLRRSFKKPDGGYGHTHTLRPSDLLPAALALTKCYEFVNDAKRASADE